MTERKFKYQKPRNTDERIEAIYEELCDTHIFNDKKQIETLKDHVVALLRQLRKVEQERKDEKEDEDYSLTISLGTLAFVSLVFLFNGWGYSQDWEWLNSHQFAIRLWGVALAAVFVGVSIERSSFFKRLWSFGFTKIITSIAVSALILFCTGKASSLINSLFGVDASVFPFTRAFMVGLLAFQYASPLLSVVALFAIFHAFNIGGYIKSKRLSDYNYALPPWNSIAFLVLAIFLLGFSRTWMNRDFSESALPAKIYRLAHALDFNSRHVCINIKEGVKVAFVGSDHSRVLVDMSDVQTEDMESFINRNISDNVNIPKEFFFLPCETGIRNPNTAK